MISSIYLNVDRENDGKYHHYDIIKIRDIANRTNGFERPNPNEGYALENDISNNSVAQDTENVNMNFWIEILPILIPSIAEILKSTLHIMFWKENL